MVGQPQGWQEAPSRAPCPVKPRFLLPPFPCGPFLGPGSPAWHCYHCATLDHPPSHLAAPSPLRAGRCVPGLLRGRGRTDGPATQEALAPELTKDRGGQREVSAGVGRSGLVETPPSGLEITGHRPKVLTEKSPPRLEGREKRLDPTS